MAKKMRPKGKAVWRSAEQGRKKGREAGYPKGWHYGFHMGQCDAALIKNNSGAHTPINHKKVIYVTAGIGVPYPALDQAIISGLGQLVSELTVTNPSEDVVLLAENVRPDVVIILNGVVFPALQAQALRSRGIKTAVWFTDDPYYTDWTMDIAPNYDYVFTLERSCVDYYKSLGCVNVYYLPFAADPDVFRPKRVDLSYHSDICFIGTAFWNRVEQVDAIAHYLVNKKVIISGWWWDRLKHYKMLAHNIRLGDWMTAEETANYYNGAKIVINMHRLSDDPSINFNNAKLPALSLNPRTFEIASCGTLQLTDIRQELNKYFTPGYDIETYSISEELLSKIDYYLTHDDERQRIAVNALNNTRQEHSYVHRLTQMLHIIFG